MRILITGGNGFLGSAICNQFTRTNHKIFVLDNTNKKNLKKNFIKGDITDLNLLKKKLKGIDVVFHLAGLSDLDTAYKNPIKTANLNILGTINILEACRLNRVKKIIFASTMYVSGNHGSFYRCSKAACEDYVKEFNKRFKLKYSILRFGSLYGPGSNSENGLYRIVKHAIEKKRVTYFGDINTRREYIHVNDAAKASLECLNNFNNKTINITGNETLKITDLLEIIREIIGINSKIKVVNKKQKGHYTLVPHNFDDDLVMKYSLNPFIDLGEGIKSLISYVKKNEDT